MNVVQMQVFSEADRLHVEQHALDRQLYNAPDGQHDAADRRLFAAEDHIAHLGSLQIESRSNNLIRSKLRVVHSLWRLSSAPFAPQFTSTLLFYNRQSQNEKMLSQFRDSIFLMVV